MASVPSRDDVLDAFSMEDQNDRATLERYLRDFPEHALAIVDLSRELARESAPYEGDLSPQEVSLIEAAWERHAAAAPAAPAIDPLSHLSVAAQREFARQLGVPRQVASALRDRQVSVSSVPRGVLRLLAEAASQTFEAIASAMATSAPAAAASYKSDGKPDRQSRVSFEQVLFEAGVSEAKRAEVMAKVD